jgi:hypothetical protein
MRSDHFGGKHSPKAIRIRDDDRLFPPPFVSRSYVRQLRLPRGTQNRKRGHSKPPSHARFDSFTSKLVKTLQGAINKRVRIRDCFQTSVAGKSRNFEMLLRTPQHSSIASLYVVYRKFVFSQTSELEVRRSPRWKVSLSAE